MYCGIASYYSTGAAIVYIRYRYVHHLMNKSKVLIRQRLNKIAFVFGLTSCLGISLVGNIQVGAELDYSYDSAIAWKPAEKHFLHTEYGYLRFYPGLENLIQAILPRLSREGYIHWLYWNSRTLSSSDVIVMLK